MKTMVLALIIAVLLFGFYNCNKDGNITPSSIISKWGITSDSTFVDVGFNNHLVNYKGVHGDYFDIRTDNKVYTKEGAVLDTLNYQLLGDTAIIISSFGVTLNGVPETCHIKNLTAHTLTIKAPELLTPGGTFGRTINLTR